MHSMATDAVGPAAVAHPGFTSIPPPDLPRLQDARLATGVRLGYAEQGHAGSPPVILLHGYSDSWYSYSRVIPALAGSHHVYALDLRGHGESDRPAGGYTMRDMASDVVAFMDSNRIDAATIAGHSMGSFVAQQVAILVPHRVTQLVLIGSATTPRSIIGVPELADAAPSTIRSPTTSSTRRWRRVSRCRRVCGSRSWRAC
jgi:pimeloyl-ACP methyl ester carboxylesterase